MSHTPMRTCVGCRMCRPQHALLRLTRASDGTIVVDAGGRRAAGRGAYLCVSESCLTSAQRRHAVARALRTGAMTPEAYERLREALTHHG